MNKSTVKKLWITILILTIIGVLTGTGVYIYVFYKPHRNYERARVDVKLAAKNLFDEYTSDQKTADQRFLGKVVEITGEMTDVEQADSLVIVVFAYRSGDFGDEGIRVTMLPDYNEKARELRPHQSVDLKGHCTGYNGTDIIIESGSILNKN